MRTNINHLTNYFILLVILSAIVSCDSFKEDSIKLENQVTFTQSEFYTVPGSAILIDLKSIIEKSFSNGTLTVSENPQRGVLSSVDTFLLKYRPGQDFLEGEDHFVLSVVRDGKILTRGTLTIKMRNNKEEFSCASVSIEDKIKLKNGGSSVSIAVLENDWLCDIGESGLNISIHKQPTFGQAIVENESIVYTPGPEFKGQDELIYQLTKATGESIAYGLVSVDDRGEFTVQKIPGRIFRSLFFTDENTGFLGTDVGMYKTTNGGTNWNISIFGSYCDNIFFVNKTKGFAVMEWGRILSTNDGGVTWEPLILIEKTVTEIIFTSETTGFIGASDGTDFSTQTSILKTEDGGVTWREVFSGLTYFGFLDIQFVNPNIGYAVYSEQVFVTTDAGETWNLFLDRSINHLVTTSVNKFFAVLFGDPSKIITVEEANRWKSLAGFSSDIMSLGFSPSADVGFASILRGQMPSEEPYIMPISIFKTVDQGKTWIDLTPDGPLDGSFGEVSLPSSNVAYFRCWDRIVKYAY